VTGGDAAALKRQVTTPLLTAAAGDPLRIHVLAPWSEQAQVFSIEGHRWRLDPQMAGSSLISSIRFGGLEALTLSLDGGAAPPGDYVYGNHRAPYMEAGLWGYLRVYSSCNGALNPLERGCPGASSITSVVAPTALAVVVLAAASVVYVRRRDVKERIPSWAQRWTHR
jgi:hypothetical protein